MAKSKSQDLAGMTPDQIRERGRELLRLAQQREIEIKNRQLVKLGEIFQREIQGGWPSDWTTLAAELEGVVGSKVEPPNWCQAAGVQGGAAPLVEVKNDTQG